MNNIAAVGSAAWLVFTSLAMATVFLLGGRDGTISGRHWANVAWDVLAWIGAGSTVVAAVIAWGTALT